MSEIQNTRMHGPLGDAEGAHEETGLVLSGFSPEEMARLLAARSQYAEGSLNEWTEDYKRLRFARWLYEQGQIGG